MNALLRTFVFGLCLTIAYSTFSSAQEDAGDVATMEMKTREVVDTAAVEMKAVEIADAWVKLIDAGEYTESWNQAAILFKEAIMESDWTALIGEARKPMGALKSREMLGKKFLTSLPNAPEGEYVVIQYKAVFEGEPMTFIETITPVKDADGQWRVSGYYIYEMPVAETMPAEAMPAETAPAEAQ